MPTFDASKIKDPEIATLASYYHLYAGIQPSDGNQRNVEGYATHLDDPSPSSDSSFQQQSPGHLKGASPKLPEDAIWVEDEWTTEDDLAAAQLLRAHEARCRVVDGVESVSTADKTQPRGHLQDEMDAAAWDRFYAHHQTNFFKDRHYLAAAFPEEFDLVAPASNNSSSNNNDSLKPVLAEIGCGVGNALLPLLGEPKNKEVSLIDDEDGSGEESLTSTRLANSNDPQWTVYGLDLSSVAIDLLRQDARFQAASKQGRAFSQAFDITSHDNSLPHEFIHKATVTSLLFCLSAIDPVHHTKAVQNALMTLRPGGVLVFRDYGRYDEAQMKLGTQRHKLLPGKDGNFYRKHDGTKCYYFTLEGLTTLMRDNCHLEILDLKYVRRVYKNRSQGTTRRRVWIQGRFRKP